MAETRIERDSMGEMMVPADAHGVLVEVSALGAPPAI